MSAYYKEHLLRECQQYVNHYLIAILLSVVGIFVIRRTSIDPFYILPFVIVLYLFIGPKRRNAQFKIQQTYRDTESLILPISDKEYFWGESFKFFVKAGPVLIIFFLLFISLEFEDKKTEFSILRFLEDFVCFSTLFYMFCIRKIFFIRFKKEPRFISFKRFLYGGLVGFFTFVVADIIGDKGGTEILIALFLFSVLAILFYDVTKGKRAFNEHTSYKAKSLKWIDIPIIVCLLVVGVTFCYSVEKIMLVTSKQEKLK